MRKRRTHSKHNPILIIILFAIIVLVVIGVYFVVNSKLDSSKTMKTNEKTEEKEEDTNMEETTSQLSEDQQKEEQKNDETKEYNFDTQTGEDEVKIEASKMVGATGFAGASNYKFYLRGTTLYFRDVSISTNEEEILAYNVKDLYLENKEVTAELYSDGKVVKENNYITYK